jgi:hypothetical protein
VFIIHTDQVAVALRALQAYHSGTKPFSISSGLPDIVTEDFHALFQSLQENAGIIISPNRPGLSPMYYS